MFASQVAYIALDITAERTREGERRARLLLGAGPDFGGPGGFRSDLARLAALVSRRAADLARRLDDRVPVDRPRRGSTLA
jgi:hypothetical protein